MKSSLPIHQMVPESPDLLQHVYGVVNGMFFMSTVLIFLLSISYYRKSNIALSGKLTVVKTYLLAGFSFLGFALYNIYYQSFTGAVSISEGIFPQWLLDISKFGSPIALAGITYVLLLITEVRSYRAYRFQQKAQWYIQGLYIMDAIALVALCFVNDPEHVALITGSIFIPHGLGSIRYCLVALKYETYSKTMALLFAFTTLIFIEFNRVLYLRTIDFSPEFLALIHFIFGINQILFAFIFLRFGYDEVYRALELKQKEQHELLHGLGFGLENGEFFLAYQPQIDLKTDQLSGIEALVRWQHPKRGLVAPDHFIKLAEDTDKINDICRWVVDNSLKEVCELQRQLGRELQISINFSAKNLNAYMLAHLKNKLSLYNISPSLVTIEITETVMLDEDEETHMFFEEIHQLGIKLSLDDYGTGFSSLSYLTKVHISELKIDRSFITDIESNRNHFVIAHSTVAMSKSLNNKIVAEGVESEETLKILKDIGCDYAQGYYIAKPMPIGDLKHWLKESPHTSHKFHQAVI